MEHPQLSGATCFSALPPSQSFSLTSHLNFSSFSLGPFPLVLSLSAHVQSCSPTFQYALFKYWKATMRSPQTLLFSRLNNPNSQPIFLGEFLKPSDHLCASSGTISIGAGPSRAEDPRTGCSSPAGVSRRWSKGGKSSPLACWPHCFGFSPGYGWPFGL